MKACEFRYEGGGEIFSTFYWAQTVGKAREQAFYDDEMGDPDRYIDIDVHRIPWADGMENASNDEVTIEALKQGYMFADPDYNYDLSDQDLPVLEKLGGSVNKFWEFCYQGKIKYDNKGISYLVNKEKIK